MTLNKELELFAAIIEPDDGYTKHLNTDEYIRKFYKFLGTGTNLDVLMFMMSLGQGEYVSARTVADYIGIADDEAKETLEYLVFELSKNRPGFKIANILDSKGNNERLYGIDLNFIGNIVVLLALTDQIINPPLGYQLQIGMRDIGWTNRSELREVGKNERKKEKS